MRDRALPARRPTPSVRYGKPGKVDRDLGRRGTEGRGTAPQRLLSLQGINDLQGSTRVTRQLRTIDLVCRGVLHVLHYPANFLAACLGDLLAVGWQQKGVFLDSAKWCVLSLLNPRRAVFRGRLPRDRYRPRSIASTTPAPYLFLLPSCRPGRLKM